MVATNGELIVAAIGIGIILFIAAFIIISKRKREYKIIK